MRSVKCKIKVERDSKEGRRKKEKKNPEERREESKEDNALDHRREI